MSFASECKAELMTIKRNIIENKALILGMLVSGAKISENEFTFSSTKVEIANYLVFLLNRVYKYKATVLEGDLQSSSFLHKYEVNCQGCLNIIDELEINHFGAFKQEIKESQNLSCAYLCGAFLARGSVNDPETTKYHFEITLDDTRNALFVQQIMNNFDLNAKIIRRRNKLVVYIKDAEKIVDVLRMIGASKNCFHY